MPEVALSGDRKRRRPAEENLTMGPLRRYIERRRVLRLLAEIERSLARPPRRGLPAQR